MNETAETKICPLCAETIKAAAKVCPYCRKSQRRWAFCTIYDVTGILTLMVFVGAVAILFLLFSGERKFVPSRDRIEVLSSQLGIDVSEERTNVVVSGVLSNATSYSWIIGDLEMRFYDKDGKIMDVMWATDDAHSRVLAHGEQSFHVSVFNSSSIPAYATYNVRVSSAGDAEKKLFQ